MEHLYLDAMNVIGSRPDGWWRDRDGAVRRLIDDLQPYAAAVDAEVVVVVDGRPIDDLPEGRHGAVEVVYAARRGRDAADDRVVDLIASADGHDDVEVVTADRELRRRVEELGARVVGPSELRRRIQRAAGGRSPPGR